MKDGDTGKNLFGKVRSAEICNFYKKITVTNSSRACYCQWYVGDD